MRVSDMDGYKDSALFHHLMIEKVTEVDWTK